MVKPSLWSGRRALLWLVPALSLGCASVLGLPDREIDPTFTDESDAGDGGTDSPACVDYCSQVMTSCVDLDTVYASEAVCLAICAKLPPGSPGTPTGNTLACRAEQARLAETTGEVKLYCPPAGPGGGAGVDGGAPLCGSNCDGFCLLMAAICPAAFPTIAACMDTCSSVPDVGGYNVTQMDGDTIQCRLYHVSAATQAWEVHCPHALGVVHCL
ncbi:MAG: hypothetical protein ABI134_10525 [Byssovorax sp.]